MNPRNPRAWLALAVLALACRPPGDEAGGLHRQLLAAASAERPFPPRLTGMPHAPCSSLGRGEPPCAAPLRAAGGEHGRALVALERRVAALAEAPAAEILHMKALWRLLTARRDDDVGAAIALLERALETAPEPAQRAALHNDLAAARLVRAEIFDRPADLERALLAAERALELAPDLDEARFNRALALERLYLDAAVPAAWHSALDADPDPASPWRQEMAARLERFAQPAAEGPSWDEGALLRALDAADLDAARPLADRFRRRARELGEGDLLAAWGEAHLAGDAAAAATALHRARTLGNLLADLGGDRLLADAVTAIERARPDPAAADRLAMGHAAYREGFELYQSGEEKALPRLEKAARLLASGGSISSARARFYAAGAHYKAERYSVALDVLAASELLPDHLAAYPALRGHLYWLRGLCTLILGRPREALVDYRLALASFELAGERSNVASSHGLLADALERLGRHDEAWHHHHRGLEIAGQAGDARSHYLIYSALSDSALRRDQPRSAEYYQLEAVAAAARTSIPIWVPESLYFLALIHSKLGDLEAARDDLERAKQRIEQHRDEQERRRAMADLARIEGVVLSRARPEQAIDRLSEALRFYDRHGHHLLRLLTLRQRAMACRRAGEIEQAARDLDAGIRAFADLARGKQPLGEGERPAFWRELHRLYDERVAVALEKGAAAEALAVVEEARTRALPLLVQASSSARVQVEQRTPLEPLPTDVIRARLPANAAVVVYALLAKSLHVWILRRDGVDEVAIELEPPILRRSLRRLAQARAGDEARWQQAAQALYDRLVRPWIDRVGDRERLVLVPDEALAGIPFAALFDGRRYLIEDHELAIAPSATLFADATRRLLQRTAGSAPQRALVVGAPDLDRQLFDDLASLPASEDELTTIAGVLDATVLRGAAATPEALLELGPRSAVVHVASHAVLEPRDPLLSLLALAPGATGRGALYARQIYAVPFTATRLVTLAACRSAGESGEGIEGPASLARAFLAAGVPAVVASLWDVDDHATARLFTTFYAHLRRGEGAAAALRAAQLALLRSSDDELSHPRHWGAFMIVGAAD
ncbi:MAG: CHAT domain-containing protein [Acidobacteria bacterium]|nr:MAG: CHAT domain-containing protein [Acidobacteriota bacterium]